MTGDRFQGAIAGVGSTSGVRIVIGRWAGSPLGRFADVMLAEPDGTRVLIAPTQEVAEYVASTYTFDQVVVAPIEVRGQETWDLSGPELELSLRLAGRTALGRLLRVVPEVIATAPAWCAVTDPVARVALRGVRTRGSAGSGRREYYGATDHHAVASLTGRWRGTDLGALAPVAPEPGFGFGSTPQRPSVTRLVTTVRH